MKAICSSFLILLITASCSRTLYYAYDEDGSRTGYPEGYCTFEIKGQDVVYRGYSYVYQNPDATPYSPSFIYIEGKKEKNSVSPVKMDAWRLMTKFIILQDLENYGSNNDNTVSIYTIPLDEISPNNLYYSTTINPDSVVNTGNDKLKFRGIGSIDWFPPYVKRVKKIDYDRYTRTDTKNINYKDPEKTTGNWGYPTHYAEKMPKFGHALPGEKESYEFDKFKNWVMSQIVYPEDVIQNGMEGWINVRIVIEKDGTVSHPSALMCANDANLNAIYQQIKTIVEKSPKWTPAKKSGKPVRIGNTTRYNFNIPPAQSK